MSLQPFTLLHFVGDVSAKLGQLERKQWSGQVMADGQTDGQRCWLQQGACLAGSYWTNKTFRFTCPPHVEFYDFAETRLFMVTPPPIARYVCSHSEISSKNLGLWFNICLAWCLLKQIRTPCKVLVLKSICL